MTITLIVDGYNAINAVPEAKSKLKESLLAARKAIVAISKEYARSSGYITDVRVVFDGSDQYRSANGTHLLHGKTQVFSRTARGDEKIIEIIRKLSLKGRVVLASNDNYVRNNARAYGASLVRAEELSRRKQTVKNPKKTKDKRIDPQLKEEITREYKEELGL